MTKTMTDQSSPLIMWRYNKGMTVKELKEEIKDWPETDQYGDDCEVWIETGINRSSPVVIVSPLNLREDDDGRQSADLLLKSGAYLTT